MSETSVVFPHHPVEAAQWACLLVFTRILPSVQQPSSSSASFLMQIGGGRVNLLHVFCIIWGRRNKRLLYVHWHFLCKDDFCRKRELKVTLASSPHKALEPVPEPGCQEQALSEQAQQHSAPACAMLSKHLLFCTSYIFFSLFRANHVHIYRNFGIFLLKQANNPVACILLIIKGNKVTQKNNSSPPQLKASS